MSGTKKHHVVAVDGWINPPPLNFEYDFTKYPTVGQDLLLEHVKDATIVITSGRPMNRAVIEAAPVLELISVSGTGTDHIDLEAARERNVAVCRVPAQNTETVGEHAFALYFALKRRILPLHNLAADGKTWAQSPPATAKAFGKPPRVNSEETLVVVGYGAIGRHVETMGRALGMNVLIAERKSSSEIREGRISFDEAVEKGTVFFIVAPGNDSTRAMFSTPEFETMDSSALIINCGRGGVVSEKEVATALREGTIGGYATDVFEREPATSENCPLLDPSVPNLIHTPHLAWFSAKAIRGTIETVKANIEGFVAGKPQNLVVSRKSGP
ncbi:glycerate dehydrogenase like protein [Zymoseptoria brevis]|uniref:Glycerate dehydrogenase like protein n=1 Tax=Zymoseptoria brevis TaxID=1047168 RepID=A0A0F4GJT3_9PEZI|nr:glycerate dehydrogenase like protein [Zymoseptoria brevis]